jgi:hypothetical protein
MRRYILKKILVVLAFVFLSSNVWALEKFIDVIAVNDSKVVDIKNKSIGVYTLIAEDKQGIKRQYTSLVTLDKNIHMGKELKKGDFIGTQRFFMDDDISKYVLNHDGIIDVKVMNSIASKARKILKEKGVALFVYVKKDIDMDEDFTKEQQLEYLKAYQINIAESIPKELKGKPYAILTILYNNQYAYLFTSEDIKDVVDQNILFGQYVFPFFNEEKHGQLYNQMSNAINNGFSFVASTIQKY